MVFKQILRKEVFEKKHRKVKTVIPKSEIDRMLKDVEWDVRTDYMKERQREYQKENLKIEREFKEKK